MKRDKLFRWTLCTLLIIAGWFAAGCAQKSEIIYKVVEAPIGCDAAKPVKPPMDAELVIAVINALTYAEELEIALDSCLR
jgi:hypothetical protein